MGNKAFTLNETLIAVIILGIIAVITIPQLINKYKTTINIVRLKRDYAYIQNSIREALISNNCPTIDCVAENHGVTPESYNARSVVPLVITGTRFQRRDEIGTQQCFPVHFYYRDLKTEVKEGPMGEVPLFESYCNDYISGGLSAWKGGEFVQSGVPIRSCKYEKGDCFTLYLYTGGPKDKAVMGTNVWVMLVQGNGEVVPYTKANIIRNNDKEMTYFGSVLKNGWKIKYQ